MRAFCVARGSMIDMYVGVFSNNTTPAAVRMPGPPPCRQCAQLAQHAVRLAAIQSTFESSARAPASNSTFLVPLRLGCCIGAALLCPASSSLEHEIRMLLALLRAQQELLGFVFHVIPQH